MFPEDITGVTVIPLEAIATAATVIPLEAIDMVEAVISLGVTDTAGSNMAIHADTGMACTMGMVSEVILAACISIISTVRTITIGLMEVTIGDIIRATVITTVMDIQDIMVTGAATGDTIMVPIFIRTINIDSRNFKNL